MSAVLTLTTPRFSIAIPDSLVSDAKTLREKTVKIGLIARAAAIFRVERISIYTDEHGLHSRDAKLIQLILEYMETPQYLRKSLFLKRAELQFVGLLPPLRTPHHKLSVPESEIKVGEFREGVTLRREGGSFVDVGLSSIVPLETRIPAGKRVTVIFTEAYPRLRCRVATAERPTEYWGFRVIRTDSLVKLIDGFSADLVVLASRYGKNLSDIWNQMLGALRHSANAMIAFGSPKRGLIEILREEGTDPRTLTEFFVNTIPNQGTATVRTEEAIFATLAILSTAIYLA